MSSLTSFQPVITLDLPLFNKLKSLQIFRKTPDNSLKQEQYNQKVQLDSH